MFSARASHPGPQRDRTPDGTVLRRGLRHAALAVGLTVLAGIAPASSVFADTPPAAAVASAEPQATRAGEEILKSGGNAFDAAVAVSAALAVVEPYSSGLGGGGFWLLHQGANGHDVMVDGREFAPGAASRNMYLNAAGKVIPHRSINGVLAAAIPGEPAALVHIARHYGHLPLTVSLGPAIRLARDGFPVTERFRRLVHFRLKLLRHSPAGKVFLKDGQVPPLGYRIVQPQLAATLTAIARHGARAFYHGKIARRMVDGVRRAGGIWTTADLARYRVIERKPVVGTYHGIRVVSASLPSSGGVVLMEILNILEGFNLPALGDVTRKHVIIEAMRRAYRDRAEYLGDPAFVTAPVARLTSKAYAAKLRASINLKHATPSSSLPPVGSLPNDGPDTTHFSIIDTQGNRVSATLSINYPFGCGYMAPGTGVILNDEMDDFSARQGVPNVYGLVGNQANAIAPYKRPLSSMTPTMLETPTRVGILGTPGGSRIISMVALATLDFAAGHPPSSWVSRPRYHHQYLPDEVQYEPGAFTPAERAGLKRMGYKLHDVGRRYGNMQAILWDRATHQVLAASDPRGEGSSVVIPASALAAHAKVARPLGNHTLP